jgi:histidinol-phosphate aminotransferase
MTVDLSLLIRPDFEDLDEYTPVKPLDVLAAEIGVPAERLVKLDANENLYGPIPEIREAVANCDMHIYPDPGQHALRRRSRTMWASARSRWSQVRAPTT